MEDTKREIRVADDSGAEQTDESRSQESSVVLAARLLANAATDARRSVGQVETATITLRRHTDPIDPRRPDQLRRLWSHRATIVGVPRTLPSRSAARSVA
jgi:hypothetical protein